jgi:ankyrin repeat protein
MSDSQIRQSILKAVEDNNIDKVKSFLESGVDVNTKNFIDQSLLHIACDRKYYDMIELLLSHPKIDLNILDSNNLTVLDVSIKKKETQVTKMLLTNKNIDINKEHTYRYTFYQSYLEKACYNSDVEIIKLLLNYPKIEIDFDITNFKTWNLKSYYLLKKYSPILKKVDEVLEVIQD